MVVIQLKVLFASAHKLCVGASLESIRLFCFDSLHWLRLTYISRTMHFCDRGM